MLVIPCYFHTEESLRMTEMELNIPGQQMEFKLRDVFFLTIDAMHRDFNEDNEEEEIGTVIFSSGERFATPMTIEQIIDMVNKQSQQ